MKFKGSTLSDVLCRIKYRFFDSDGYLSIPVRIKEDYSKECLVMIWGGGNDWHVLAFMSKNMVQLFRKSVEQSHYSYITDMIIEGVDNESKEVLQSYMTPSPYEDNTYFVNHHTWYQITLDIEYKMRERIEVLEHENKQLRTDKERSEDKKRLNRELTEQRRAIKEERRTIAAERKALREETPTKSYERSYGGYVYLLKVLNSDTLYKIGRTSNPDNRLRTFNVKLPFPVEYEHLIETDNMYQLERELHNKYQKQRKRGSEFFTLTQADIEYIKSL